jgi:hypothetical protein
MRYLNKYKHYKESIDYKNILEDIEDILLPIKDLGYNNIKVNFNIFGKTIGKRKRVKEYEYYIFINVIDYDNDPLIFSEDIYYDFDRLFDYLYQNNLKLNTVYYKKVEPDGTIFNRFSRDLLNMSYFDINYLKKMLIDEKIAYLSFEVGVDKKSDN